MVFKHIAAAMLATAVVPASAAAHVTPEAAQNAAGRAVGWYETQQSPDGNLSGFGGDWSMIALANAGVNAADLRRGVAAPSLQDYYAGSWTADGPGDSSTDQSRALLAGHGGGIQRAKLSAGRNVVARQLQFFDGTQLGLTSTVNDDMFGLLALARNGVGDLAPVLAKEVRRVQAGGGWNFGTSGAPDTDMTGVGIAALCEAGAAPSDAAVAEALTWLGGRQDDATGGFASTFIGVNVDSTAWVVDGLRECGIDPQSAEWTTAAGKTPLDFLVAMQKDNGAFRWAPGDDGDDMYATQDAVTALVGEGFGTEPAARSDGRLPALRPAPDVAAGTVMPMALVIDHGPAEPGAERACSVEAAVGGTVAGARRYGSPPRRCSASRDPGAPRAPVERGGATFPRVPARGLLRTCWGDPSRARPSSAATSRCACSTPCSTMRLRGGPASRCCRARRGSARRASRPRRKRARELAG